MTKLMNIEGHWNNDDSATFHPNDVWSGELFLEEDGWFTGIVTNPNSTLYTGDRFIFGLYYEDKIIELYKFAPSKYSAPFLYEGEEQDGNYYGEYSCIGVANFFPYGMFSIKLEEKQDINEEKISDLKERISKFIRNGDVPFLKFYNRELTYKEELKEIVKAEHYNKFLEPSKKKQKQYKKLFKKNKENL